MQVSRRRFLALVGAVTAASGLPREVVAKELARVGDDAASLAAAAAELTTLAQTYGAGPAGNLGYRPVVTLPGESRLVRDELASPVAGRETRRTTLVNFVHLTDQHIVDVQSTARVEFLDRYNDNHCGPMPFSAAFRPHEAASARITDAMNRRIRAIAYSPVTGTPLQAAIATGDNTDNQQLNELELFIGLMDGGPVTPDSGSPDGYEGVQKSGDVNYWHPDPGVQDKYKTQFGYPEVPNYLEDSLAGFSAAGVGLPWYTCFGNHDGLVQGNAPSNPVFERIAVGGTKVVGTPDGTNPCTEFDGLGAVPGAPTRTTTADPKRTFVTRKQWIQKHIDSTGLPKGHGFSEANATSETLYYSADVGAIRWIVLDTVNPGGYADGSIGDKQLKWLEAELVKAQAERKIVMLFSHHGLRSLNNPLQEPDPLQPTANDLPRHGDQEVLAVVTKYSCVIAWVNGHSHNNVITVQPTFWDIGTAAHIDWPAQSRLIELVDNQDGTLSIFTTIIDHEDDLITARARELALNDPQQGGETGGRGQPSDRNTELVITHPFPGTTGAASPGNSAFGRAQRPTLRVAHDTKMSGLTIGGALALATARKVIDFRSRGLGDPEPDRPEVREAGASWD